MIVLRAGERAVVRARVLSPHGPGTLWITDRAVACEIDGRGLFLNFVPRASVASLERLGRSPYGTRLRLSWEEEGGACRFEFRARDPAPLLSELGPTPQPDSSSS